MSPTTFLKDFCIKLLYVFLRNLPSPSYSRMVVVVSGSEKIIIAVITSYFSNDSNSERERPNAGGDILVTNQGSKGAGSGRKVFEGCPAVDSSRNSPWCDSPGASWTPSPCSSRCHRSDLEKIGKHFSRILAMR